MFNIWYTSFPIKGLFKGLFLKIAYPIQELEWPRFYCVACIFRNLIFQVATTVDSIFRTIPGDESFLKQLFCGFCMFTCTNCSTHSPLIETKQLKEACKLQHTLSSVLLNMKTCKAMAIPCRTEECCRTGRGRQRQQHEGICWTLDSGTQGIWNKRHFSF